MSEQTNCARCNAECMPWKIESDIFMYCSAWCETNHLKELDEDHNLLPCAYCGSHRYTFSIKSSLSEDDLDKYRGHPLLKRQYCSLNCTREDAALYNMRGNKS